MTSRRNRPPLPMSRRTRKAVFILCLLVVGLLAYLDNNFIHQFGRSNSAASARQSRTSDIEKYHDKLFNVVYVVDGDTLDINIPDSNSNRTRIRLWGVDTPETKSEEFGVMYFGPEASEFTKKSAQDKQVRIYLDQQRDTRDKFGRLLAYVQLPDGSFLNETLLSEGFAYADLRFKHDFYNKYKQLESAARSTKRGLWENVTFEQMPKWRQERRSKN